MSELVYNALKLYGPCSSRKLAREMNFSYSVIIRNLSKMKKKGLVDYTSESLGRYGGSKVLWKVI